MLFGSVAEASDMEIGSEGYHFGIHFLPRPAAHHRDVDPLKPASAAVVEW